MNNTQHEVRTIAPRSISLQLSTADVERLSKKATSAGLSIAQLLESFIGDLVCGTYSNGSDERIYAETWYNRCGFEHTTRKSFLCFLLNEDTITHVLGLWDDYQGFKADFEDDAEDITEEDRRSAKEALEETMSELMDFFKSYQMWAGVEAKPMEEELAEMLRWKSDLDVMLHPSAQ